mgnify:CR=1 FL=1
MRRALVLTDEAARHPFLASMPPHIRRGLRPIGRRIARHLDLQDLKDFLFAYCACFVAVSTFLM